MALVGFGLCWTWNWGVLYLWFAVVLMVGSDTDVNIRMNKLLLDNTRYGGGFAAPFGKKES